MNTNTGLNMWLCSCCQQIQVTPTGASSKTVVNDHLKKCHGSPFSSLRSLLHALLGC